MTAQTRRRVCGDHTEHATRSAYTNQSGDHVRWGGIHTQRGLGKHHSVTRIQYCSSPRRWHGRTRSRAPRPPSRRNRLDLFSRKSPCTCLCGMRPAHATAARTRKHSRSSAYRLAGKGGGPTHIQEARRPSLSSARLNRSTYVRRTTLSLTLDSISGRLGGIKCNRLTHSLEISAFRVAGRGAGV